MPGVDGIIRRDRLTEFAGWPLCSARCMAVRRYVGEAAVSRWRKGVRKPLRDIVRDCPNLPDAEMAEKTP